MASGSTCAETYGSEGEPGSANASTSVSGVGSMSRSVRIARPCHTLRQRLCTSAVHGCASGCAEALTRRRRPHSLPTGDGPSAQPRTSPCSELRVRHVVKTGAAYRANRIVDAGNLCTGQAVSQCPNGENWAWGGLRDEAPFMYQRRTALRGPMRCRCRGSNLAECTKVRLRRSRWRGCEPPLWRAFSSTQRPDVP